MAFIVMLLINVGAAWLWLRWMKKQDIYAVKKRQGRTVPLFFAVGLLSGPFSSLFYDTNLWYPLVSGEVSYFFFVNAPSEELAKFLAFWITARLARSVKDPQVALLQGASVGLGFAVEENFLYATWIDPYWMVIRALFTIAGHMCWTSLAAFAWGAADYWYGRLRQRGNWGYTVLGLCLATVAHASFNSFSALGPGGILLRLPFRGITFMVLILGMGDATKLSLYYNHPWTPGRPR